MKINFGKELRDLDGNTILGRDENGVIISGKPPVTLGDQITLALCSAEPSIDGAEKFKRGMLAVKIHGKGEVEISIEEAAKIKEVSGKYLSVLAVTQIWNLLESSESNK